MAAGLLYSPSLLSATYWGGQYVATRVENTAGGCG